MIGSTLAARLHFTGNGRATPQTLRATTVEEKPDTLAHAIEALAAFVGNVEDKLFAELDAVRHRLL